MDKFNKYIKEVQVHQNLIDQRHSSALKYGTIIYDSEIAEGPNHYRLRTINVDDIIYVDWMRNGAVIFCTPISDKKIDIGKEMPQ